MELKDFIKSTFEGIIDGVISSQKYAAEHGAVINPEEFGTITPNAIMNRDNDSISMIQRVDFNLILQQSSEGNGKIGISVLDIFNINGSVNNSNTNSIFFSVPFVLPKQKNNNK